MSSPEVRGSAEHHTPETETTKLVSSDSDDTPDKEVETFHEQRDSTTSRLLSKVASIKRSNEQVNESKAKERERRRLERTGLLEEDNASDDEENAKQQFHDATLGASNENKPESQTLAGKKVKAGSVGEVGMTLETGSKASSRLSINSDKSVVSEQSKGGSRLSINQEKIVSQSLTNLATDINSSKDSLDISKVDEVTEVEVARPASRASKFSETALVLNETPMDTAQNDPIVSPTDSNVTSVDETFKSVESMATSEAGTFKSAASAIQSRDISFKSADSVYASASEIQMEEFTSLEVISEKKKEEMDTQSTEAKQPSTGMPPSGNNANQEVSGIAHAMVTVGAALTAQPAACPIYGFCPPGLECLLDTGQLVIHKDNLRHSKVFNDRALCKMEVIDETRRVMFYAEQEPPPLGPKSFLFKLYNKENQEAINMYCPDSATCLCRGATWHWFKKCYFQAMIFAPIGQVAGFVRRSRTYFVQEYEILNAQEEVVLLLRGGPLDLEIYTPDLENELGRLSVHGWHGIMHEVRRSAGDLGITFPIDLDLRIKAVLLGAVFAIDWIHSTHGGKRSR